MKRFLLLYLGCLFAIVVKAQNYDFTAVNDDGVTLYYKITDEANREVELAQNDAWNAYSTITRMVIPDKVKNVADHNKEYTVVDVNRSLSVHSNLEEIFLPNTLKHLDAWQPFNSVSVKRWVLPASCERYQAYIFHIQDKLEEVYLLRETPPVSPAGFQAFGMLNPAVFKGAYVPIDCSSAYKANPLWKTDPYDEHYHNFPLIYREQVTIGSTGYISFYLDTENFKVPKDCYAYIITGTKTGRTGYPDAQITAYGEGSIIPQKTGFILEAPAGTLSYEAAVAVQATDPVADVTNSMMVGTRTGEEFSGGNYKYYVFANGEKGLGFYHQGDRKGTSIKLRAHQAGLKLSTSGPAPAKGFVLDFEEARRNLTTGIRSIVSQDKQQQETIYDLQGRRVTNPTRGIYIVNGKKQIFN
jgi:hypothetical protein